MSTHFSHIIFTYEGCCLIGMVYCFLFLLVPRCTPIIAEYTKTQCCYTPSPTLRSIFVTLRAYLRNSTPNFIFLTNVLLCMKKNSFPWLEIELTNSAFTVRHCIVTQWKSSRDASNTNKHINLVWTLRRLNISKRINYILKLRSIRS